MLSGNVVKNSQSSPLIIAEVRSVNSDGRIGLTICPGKKDASRGWDRSLNEDLHAIHSWGATAVVTLIEDHEFTLLGVEELETQVNAMGMAWLHLPIRDVDVPDHRFEVGWKNAGPAIHQRLDAGERVLIHCRGGLGRRGLVAGVILVERGIVPRNAIQRVRAARPHAIETLEQERYVLAARASNASSSNSLNEAGDQVCQN